MRWISFVLLFGLAAPVLAIEVPPSNENPEVAPQVAAPLQLNREAPSPDAAPEPATSEAIPLNQIATGDLFSLPADIAITSETLQGLILDVREKRVKRIAFTDHQEVHNDTLVMLAGLNGLQGLDLKGTSIDTEGLRALAGFKNLRELDLTETAVGSEGMEVVGTLTQLRILRLRNTRIDDSGVWKLKNLKALEELDLGGTSITGKALTGLQALTALKTLDLGETKVADGLDALRSLKKIENLHLNDTPITDEALLPIRWLPNLHFLNISCTKTTDKTISRFSIEKGIQVLNACGR